MKLRSIHARLIAGAAVWTVGILVAAFTVGVAVARTHPHSSLFIHNSMLTLTGVVLVTAGLSVLRRGLSPFRILREHLAAVRDGRAARLNGEYPTEVAPLVDDLNALLEEREHRVSRAIAKAGDLAHGLKTPLAVLSNEANRLAQTGQPDAAASIAHQVSRMQRQIEYHLAHARASASGATSNARCDLATSADALVRTLHKLYEDRALAIDARIDPSHGVRCQRVDLDEMLGNLLDNACKWGRSRIRLSSAASADSIEVAVEDDGRGIEPALREAVQQRGVRADEAAPGSGLGLAIVRDLAEIYGGSVTLDASPLGGLRVRLRLPRA